MIGTEGRYDMSETTRPPIDQPATVRKGEELDVIRLAPYLKESIADLDGELVVLQFPSGHSNLTYLLRFGDRELVLRRPPFGSKPKTGHDMEREHDILLALHDVFPYCPKPLLLCDDETILGCPFFVMERVAGIIIRRDIPADLEMSPAAVARLFAHLVDVFVELHAIDHISVGLTGIGKPDGYVARQIRGWSERYRRARTPDVPDCESVMTWLAANTPPESERVSVIHNDFRLDNVVLDPEDPLRIVGVLDWEMATVGDPLMDLGATLAYWIERDDPPEAHILRMMPTHVNGAPTRRQMIDMYSERAGLDVGSFDFYYCYGLFRLAVIAQQIYYRSYHGQTKDPRFNVFNQAVLALESAARRVIDGGEW
jgi:aminoglycoside phosphotransferase (APT) family kinase protein